MVLFTQRCRTRSARVGAALAVGALAVVGSVGQASAAALTNPGFESDLDGWAPLAGTAVTVTSDAPHSAVKAAAVSRKTTSGAAGITDSPNQFSSVPSGTECTANAWVKGPNGYKATLRLVALNGTSTVLTKSATVTFTGSWQQTPTVLLTMPSTASTADLRVIAPSFPVEQTWYLDDVTASCDGTSEPPAPPPGVAGHWGLNEVGTPPATANDDSGNGNHGSPSLNVRGDGTGYTFNGTDTKVVVPDSNTLDPGGADFSFGVTLLMTAPPQVGETYDLLRKGVSTIAGGYYKLEVKHASGKAVAGCLFKDANKVIAGVRAGTSLADGRNHAVTCKLSGNTVSILVDGDVKVTKTVAIFGTISNSSELGLGAKAEGTATTGFDWYLGELSDAFVRIG
jgi:hypothetical protein